MIKHPPGHGCAREDSHLGLLIVEAAAEQMACADWLPFAPAGRPPAMTAHVLYPALDAARPATLSLTIIEMVIRDAIGFEALSSATI